VRTELVHLRQEQLDPCDGTQDPSLRADFRSLYNRLLRADGIILGTPTYWFNMSGLMKNLLDRLLIAEEQEDWPLEGKVAGFIATGEPHEDGAMIALSSMAATANHLGMITFPYSMVYLREDRPTWAKKTARVYAENMLHMIELVRRDEGAEWK
jgi:multimeric flavodoxin WrbA